MKGRTKVEREVKNKAEMKITKANKRQNYSDFNIGQSLYELLTTDMRFVSRKLLL